MADQAHSDLSAVDATAAPAVLAYTIPAAVSASGLSRTRIYQAIGDGRLNAVKAGRRTLITRDSLVAMIESLPAAEIGKAAKVAAMGGGR